MSDLLESLGRGGSEVAEGTFKVDTARALERLAQHRLTEPSHWVLEILRAAHCAGASGVDILTTRTTFAVHFDGEAFTPKQLDHLLELAVEGGISETDRHARLLGLGVAAALGRGASEVTVSSGGQRLTVRPPSSVERGTAPKGHTRVVATFPGLRLFEKVGAAEVAAIRERCIAFGPHLNIDHEFLSLPPYLGDLQPVKHTLKDVEVRAVPAPGAIKSVLALVQHGVVVAFREREPHGEVVRAVLSSPVFRRDASGSDVVATDPVLLRALGWLDEVSIDFLDVALPLCAERGKDGYRRRFLSRLADEKLPAKVRLRLEAAPLLRTPSNQPLDLKTVWKLAEKNGVVLIATQNHGKGATPEGTVWLEPALRLQIEAVLPELPTRDVAEQVRKHTKASEARARWEEQTKEAPSLPAASYLEIEAVHASTRARGPRVEGVVGLHHRGQGAFVRLLVQGKLVQQGEVPSLAPWSLSAVVDWKGEVPERAWHELPSPHLYSLVNSAIEEAAGRALGRLLSRESPEPALLMLGVEWFCRLARTGQADSLPDGLRTAKLWPLVGGGRVSLAELEPRRRWAFVSGSPSLGLLDGTPVLVLGEPMRAALETVFPKRLEDASERLQHERGVRSRLAGTKRRPSLSGVAAQVKIEGDGFFGLVGVPNTVTKGLELTLLRDGIVLEETSLSATHGLAVASVECAALEPGPRWETAVRDGTYERVLAAVRDGEERVALELVKVDFEKLSPGAARYLLAYAAKRLATAPGAGTPGRAVELAAHFDTAHGTRSLAQLREVARDGGTVWFTRQRPKVAVPESMTLVVGGDTGRRLLEAALGRSISHAEPELERLAARQHFLQREPHPTLEPGPFGARARDASGEVVVRLGDGSTPHARLTVLLEGRRWLERTLDAHLPLEATVELSTGEPSDADWSSAQQQSTRTLVLAAERKVLGALLAAEPSERRTRALRVAAGARADDVLEGLPREQLRKTALFPCTDGELRSVSQLDKTTPLHFVTHTLSGTPRSGRSVFLADGPELASALHRWRDRLDVTTALAAELEARATRAATPEVETIRVPLETRWRAAVKTEWLEGEVVLAPGAKGSLAVHTERRLVCQLEGALPEPLAGAVDTHALGFDAAFSTVARDGQLAEVVAVLGRHAHGLATQAAQAWPTLSTEEQWRQRTPLAALALWAASDAPKKAKKKQPLTTVPLFLTTEPSRFVSLHQLFEEQRERQRVPYADEPGTLLDTARFVWRPRPGERALVSALGLQPVDHTESLRQAEAVRRRPKVRALAAPVESGWRETVAGPLAEAEVALRAEPDGELEVHLLHDETVLEVMRTPHPVGGVAMLRSPAVKPNAKWDKAQRTQALAAALGTLEPALETLVARRLTASTAATIGPLAQLAAKWKAGQPGPVATALEALPLFTRLDGEPLTVGAVLAESSRHRLVHRAIGSHPAPAGELVLRDDPPTRELLQALGVRSLDLTQRLEQVAAFARERETRRLRTLEWRGDALVRVAIDAHGFKGELALPIDAEGAQVTLVREGIAVCALEGAPEGLAGVLACDALEVDEAWRSVTLTADQRLAVHAAVARPYEVLAVQGSAKHRHAARQHALDFFAHHGLERALHVERLQGAAALLAGTPLFPTIGGAWASLQSLAQEVAQHGQVPAIAKRFFTPDVGDFLVLEPDALDDHWLGALERVLGKGTIDRVHDAKAWRRSVDELDPATGTPERHGLEQVRRHVRLLRAGALGVLGPEELKAVRVHRGDGSKVVRFDARRRVALLDLEHPLARESLAQARARPERVFVLVLAIFGAINRAFHHVTDAHEAELQLALARHLRANPELLEPGEPP